MQAVRLEAIEQVQNPVENRHLLIWRNHINTGPVNNGPIPHLNDLHGGGPLEQFHHKVLLRRLQVLDNDKSYPALGRNIPQKKIQGLQPAG
jgi:hypothetical protein